MHSFHFTTVEEMDKAFEGSKVQAITSTKDVRRAEIEKLKIIENAGLLYLEQTNSGRGWYYNARSEAKLKISRYSEFVPVAMMLNLQEWMYIPEDQHYASYTYIELASLLTNGVNKMIRVRLKSRPDVVFTVALGMLIMSTRSSVQQERASWWVHTPMFVLGVPEEKAVDWIKYKDFVQGYHGPTVIPTSRLEMWYNENIRKQEGSIDKFIQTIWKAMTDDLGSSPILYLSKNTTEMKTCFFKEEDGEVEINSKEDLEKFQKEMVNIILN